VLRMKASRELDAQLFEQLYRSDIWKSFETAAHQRQIIVKAWYTGLPGSA